MTSEELHRLQESNQELNSKIQKLQQRFSKILKALPFGTIAVSDSGVIKTADAQSADLVGFSQKELVGKNLSEIIDNTELKNPASQDSRGKMYSAQLQTKSGNPLEVLIAVGGNIDADTMLCILSKDRLIG